ncbi:MPN domain-containing protein [Mycena sanguinolenta]|uniref:MPN domain-containing protein n=1 Tax=Mycena sanguinolenta TaxID=230812 RepID=A0A8H7DJA2_9AGAR|nr:MPN domain-containing protein [Mycena sanguinolenta]
MSSLSGQENWYTTSNGSVFIPSGTTSSSSHVSSTSGSSSSVLLTSNSIPSASGSLTTFTTIFSTTVTEPTTTFTSLAESVVVTPASVVGASATTSLSPQADLNSNPVCIGSGVDASSDGLLASVLIPSFIGLLIWLLFAILRPRFRQLYGLREWFVEQDLRPKPLSSSLFAFLHPPVPLVPPVPSDVSDMGKSPAGDAALFPADEELSQRAIWIAFLIALGWAFLGLAGALPLYMVTTPCIAGLPNTATFSGAFSTLEDLSLMRLLRAFDSGQFNVSTANLVTVTNTDNDPEHLRVRVIILTVLVLVVALLPALYKIIKELNRLIAYRNRWAALRCEGKQLGWLSARKAPGFVGWGEQRVKDFVVKSGLSSGMQGGTVLNGANRRRRENGEDEEPNQEEMDALQVDITNIFSICDTQRLALLIDERDEILENLEIAETRYISSFRLTTPDPSIADFQLQQPSAVSDDGRPYISHPQPLRNTSTTRKPRRKRSTNPAFASSSLAPTSFVAPSLYYKLNRVAGVSGGQFGGEDAVAEVDEDKPTLSQTINSRLVGSRFQEVNRNSAAYGRLPLGSHVRVDQTGELGPIDELGYTRIPDPQRFGPNYGIEEGGEGSITQGGRIRSTMGRGRPPPSSPFSFRTRRNREATQSTMGTGTVTGTGTGTVTGTGLSSPTDPQASTSTRRETFPFRRRKSSANETQTGAEEIPPPHLRLQARQPFVRPNDNINFDHLGEVYSDITQWRSRLKAINAEIGETQTTGPSLPDWLVFGYNNAHCRFVDGVEIIEGLAKEDVRWDVLQNERGTLDAVVLWCLLGLAAVLLAAGLTAAAGLALATAPDVAHYLPFLAPLLSSKSVGDNIASGLATVLAPAVAVVLFVSLAVAIINFSAHVRGSVSVSGTQLFVFQAMFYVLVGIAAIWLITVGALIYTLQAFNNAGAGGSDGRTENVANGAIYMAILALSVVFTCAIIFPGLQLLQPHRLWTVLRAEKRAVTPRQRFRAVYPRTYNPAFATGACILAIIFASTFSIIFPLVGPAVVILLFLSLVAHRFLIGYVYARTHSQTGGLLQIWLMRRFGTLLSLQPILLGLIFLSREFWIEGGVLCGTGVFVILFVEIYVITRTRQPGRRSLSPITRDSLDVFKKTMRPATAKKRTVDDESTSLVSSARVGHRTRGSMASVLEMMSVTLAVMPPRRPEQVSIPLKTETLDDLTATERAARTHPDAPPHLPQLSFTDHAREMASILYAPELIAPPPIIWLPNDAAGVARSEAVDLQKYHDLRVTLDVRSKDDVMMPLQQRSARGR